MQAEQIVRNLLLACNTVTERVGNRIYVGTIPAGAAFPAIVITLRETTNEAVLDSPALYRRSVVSVEAIATRPQLDELAQLISNCLLSTAAIDAGVWETAAARIESYDVERDLFVAHLDYIVFHQGVS